MIEEESFGTEEGGVELGNIAITKEEVNEMLHGNNANASAKDEEVTGNTMFVHVGDQPRCFMMPFVVHETVMTKEILACMLGTHFVEENPMVIGHEEACLVMMGGDKCTDNGWVEAALNFVDFNLNVSSQLSEKRSDKGSEEFLECKEEQPHITTPIGCGHCGETVEEEIESDEGKYDGDDISVSTMGVDDLEGELKQDEGPN